MYDTGNTMIPAVRLMGPNDSCFVSKTFAVIRQTQNSVPKSINSTLTRFFSCSILFLVLLKRVRPSLGFRKYPCGFAAAKVRISEQKNERKRYFLCFSQELPFSGTTRTSAWNEVYQCLVRSVSNTGIRNAKHWYSECQTAILGITRNHTPLDIARRSGSRYSRMYGKG